MSVFPLGDDRCAETYVSNPRRHCLPCRRQLVELLLWLRSGLGSRQEAHTEQRHHPSGGGLGKLVDGLFDYRSLAALARDRNALQFCIARGINHELPANAGHGNLLWNGEL